MARIKLGTTVVGIRGTLGGIVFSNGIGGPNARAWRAPALARSRPKLNSQANLAFMAARWRSLTSTNRSNWNAFAADPAQEKTNSLGEAYFATGFNWQCEVNIQLDQAVLALQANPPTSTRPAIPSGITVDAAVGSMELVFPLDPYPPGIYAVVYAAPSASGATTAPTRGFRFLDSQLMPDDTAIDYAGGRPHELVASHRPDCRRLRIAGPRARRRRRLMARITYGPIVSDARGAIGNTTFTRGRAGSVARSKSRPTNKQTPRQLAARARVSAANRGWFGLTAAQQTYWTGIAAAERWTSQRGADYTPTGRQVWLRYRITALQFGFSAAAVLVAPYRVGAFASMTWTLAVPQDLQTVVTTPVSINASRIGLYLAKPLGPSADLAPAQYRFVGSLGNTGNTLDWDAVLAAAGVNFATGQRYALALRGAHAQRLPGPLIAGPVSTA